jgi:hypothetical protein
METKTILKLNQSWLISTSGTGLWTTRVADVHVRQLQLVTRPGEVSFGELCVVFNARTWNTKKHGLIYTDPNFLRVLKQLLRIKGFDVRGLDYSEAGMQGSNYVSFDVNARFIASWQRLLKK